MGECFEVMGHAAIIALIWDISIHIYINDRADGISCGYYLTVAAILTITVIMSAYVFGVYFGHWLLGTFAASSWVICCWGNCNACSRSEHEKRSKNRCEH